MSAYAALALALMIGGLAPGLYLAARGDPVSRVVGLELTTSVTVLTLMLLSQASGLTYDLVVPLVLVPLSFAGTLVFTRLLRR